MIELKVEDTLVVMSCAVCTMQFALPKVLCELRQEDHKPFFCPAGHKNVFRRQRKKQGGGARR